MVLKQSNQFVYGALTMALLVALAVTLYFFVSNLSRPTPTTPEEIKPATSAPTVVKPAVVTPTVTVKPTVTPTVEATPPPADLNSTGAMFRGNPQHTGFFDTPGPERGELKWKFKAKGMGGVSPAIVKGVVYFGGGRDNYLYAVDSETGQEKWNFKTDGTVETPVVAGGLVYVGSWDKHLIRQLKPTRKVEVKWGPTIGCPDCRQWGSLFYQ